MTSNIILLTPLLALALSGCTSKMNESKITTQTSEHPEWGKIIRLANGEVEAVIAPERGGRLMRYSRLGETNILWIAPDINSGHGDQWGWRNWGGEKNWLWPQDDWPNGDWPPPLDVEQAPWHVDAIRETKRDEIPVIEIAMSAETFVGKMTRIIDRKSVV